MLAIHWSNFWISGFPSYGAGCFILMFLSHPSESDSSLQPQRLRPLRGPPQGPPTLPGSLGPSESLRYPNPWGFLPLSHPPYPFGFPGSGSGGLDPSSTGSLRPFSQGYVRRVSWVVGGAFSTSLGGSMITQVDTLGNLEI